MSFKNARRGIKGEEIEQNLMFFPGFLISLPGHNLCTFLPQYRGGIYTGNYKFT
jgi:hypothetical protein